MKVEWPSWAPVPNRPYVSVNVKQHQKKKNKTSSELWNCVKVEMDVWALRPYSICGRKATLNLGRAAEFRSCVKVEVDVLGSPTPIIRMVSVDVKHH